MGVSISRLAATATTLILLVSAQTAPPKRDWPLYGGDKGFNRYSPRDQINRSNVKGLTVLWTRPGDSSITDKFPDLSPSPYLKAS
jgi:glucose dehydrogenase